MLRLIILQQLLLLSVQQVPLLLVIQIFPNLRKFKAIQEASARISSRRSTINQVTVFLYTRKKFVEALHPGLLPLQMSRVGRSTLPDASPCHDPQTLLHSSCSCALVSRFWRIDSMACKRANSHSDFNEVGMRSHEDQSISSRFQIRS